MNTEEIISEVRFITGYPELVFGDEKLQDSISFTKREMRSLLNDPEFDDFEDHYAERALMWGTCYHLKISTGEIGGMPLSIGDVNLESTVRSRGDPNGDMLEWSQKFYDNFYKIDGAPLGIGHSVISRDDRQYEIPETSDYGGS